MANEAVDGERWPPVYDADELLREIRRLSKHEDVSVFYERLRRPGPSQGDIVRLDSTIPLINRAGKPQVQKHPTGLWLQIGNSCDFDRDLTDCEWTQLVPIYDLRTGSGPVVHETALQRYETSRLFFLPAWSSAVEDSLFVADLTRPVHLHKAAFGEHVETVASMQRAAWMLLNACLVRFLARDDGRFD